MTTVSNPATCVSTKVVVKFYQMGRKQSRKIPLSNKSAAIEKNYVSEENLKIDYGIQIVNYSLYVEFICIDNADYLI